MRELLLGCGNNRDKKVNGSWTTPTFTDLVTVDIDPSCKPDIVHDLNVMPYPLPDNEFDEIHAYEVLEHLGRQGDYKFFFDQFHELWRVLKPGGYLVATVPMWDSPWAWADPGHTRIITRQSLIFLDKREYAQIGKTSMTDYRHIWRGDFQIQGVMEKDDTFGFILKSFK